VIKKYIAIPVARETKIKTIVDSVATMRVAKKYFSKDTENKTDHDIWPEKIESVKDKPCEDYSLRIINYHFDEMKGLKIYCQRKIERIAKIIANIIVTSGS